MEELTKQFIEANDIINLVCRKLIDYKAYYGAPPSEAEVRKAISSHMMLLYDACDHPNRGYSKAYHEMEKNIEFIKKIATSPNTLNKYAAECWLNGTPSRMCGLDAYYISKELLLDIINRG